MSHDIFISYSRRDLDHMMLVRDSLRAAAFQVWTDEGIEPGTESWKHSISAAIKDCKWVVVLFSPESAESTWVNRELDFAELHRKKIYPLLVRGEPENSIPFGYTTYQFIDIRHDQAVESGLQKLIHTLHGHFDGTKHVMTAHPQTRQPEQIIKPGQPEVSTSEEILWKWVETSEIRLTLPVTTKTSSPDEANLQRIIRLMAGGNDSMFVRMLQNWDRLGYLFTGFKSVKIQPILLFSDISSLSPIVGFIAEVNAWFLNPFAYLFAPYVIQTGKLAAVMQDKFDLEINDIKWAYQSADRVISVKSYLQQHQDSIPTAHKAYGKVFPGVRKCLFIAISCEQSRFISTEPLFDQIAKSLAFT